MLDTFQELFFQLKAMHSSETISVWISTGGLLLVTAIIFAETGLLLGFFLPGDSLLITAGVLCHPENPNHVAGLSIWAFQICLAFAAIIGDQTGFFLGTKAGSTIFQRPDGRFFKKKYLFEAKAFYEKHGPLAIVACRFFPILRTFVPFVAGVTLLPYKKYFPWSIVGGLLWITSLLWIGYFLGQTEWANRLDKLIVIVITVSVLPMVLGTLKRILFPTRLSDQGGTHE